MPGPHQLLHPPPQTHFLSCEEWRTWTAAVLSACILGSPHVSSRQPISRSVRVVDSVTGLDALGSEVQIPPDILGPCS